MNTIRVSGKVVKKEKAKNNDYYLKIVLAMPLWLTYTNNGTFKQCYYYFTFILSVLYKEQFKQLRKGSHVEIIGQIGGNCNEDGTLTDELIIFPKSIKKELCR